ncbi:MAG: GFA family protein [Solirubrobacteraceae bacterium]
MSTLEGGCLCGAVRYTYTGAVGRANYCHCTDCRRRTGGPFNVSVRLSADAFRIMLGDPAGFTKTGDRGDVLTRHFCRDCGSPLFTSSESHPDDVYVTAGSLDDPTRVEPGVECWTRSRVSWSRIPDGVPSYPAGRG